LELYFINGVASSQSDQGSLDRIAMLTISL